MRQQFLDLGFRPVRRGQEQFFGVLRRQVGGQEADRAQVEPALRDCLEDARELPRQPCGPDPVVGGVFR